MLIVEGSDLTGKTHLCRRLVEHLDLIHDVTAHYRHMDKPGPGFDRYHGHADLMEQWVVQDRFHLGEWVYPQVRKEKPIDAETMRLVEGSLRRCGAYVVVLTSTPELLRERFEKRDRAEMYDLDKILQANLLYTHLPPKFDVDMKFLLDRKRPFVTEYEIGVIADAYVKRQQFLNRVVKRANRVTETLQEAQAHGATRG